MMRSVIVAGVIFPDEGEQQLVSEFLGARPGIFVDVGAHHPRDGSQTWHLEQRGWTGVLVEPLPNLADRLRKERTASVYQVACSCPSNSGKEMPFYSAGHLSSLHEGWSSVDGKPIMVSVRSLDEVLSDARSSAPVDLLSIDVEGHGLQVLKGANLARWQPRLILIEDHVTNLRTHRYLVSQGYRWIRRTGLNSWYVPVDGATMIGFLGTLQFARKYYLGLPFRHARDQLRKLRARITPKQGLREGWSTGL
jgi:FkbM family methyltransferase